MKSTEKRSNGKNNGSTRTAEELDRMRRTEAMFISMDKNRKMKHMTVDWDKVYDMLSNDEQLIADVSVNLTFDALYDEEKACVVCTAADEGLKFSYTAEVACCADCITVIPYEYITEAVRRILREYDRYRYELETRALIAEHAENAAYRLGMEMDNIPDWLYSTGLHKAIRGSVWRILEMSRTDVDDFLNLKGQEAIDETHRLGEKLSKKVESMTPGELLDVIREGMLCRE